MIILYVCVTLVTFGVTINGVIYGIGYVSESGEVLTIFPVNRELCWDLVKLFVWPPVDLVVHCVSGGYVV
jgi:hypothetical protein